LSSEKKSLHYQIIDYFSRYNDDGEKKLTKFDQNKASALSLHPSKLPKYPKGTYSPVSNQKSQVQKAKTTNKKFEMDAIDLSQKRVNPFTGDAFPKNLVPVNLNSTLSKFDNFTYKSPNEIDFNEFKSEDHVDVGEGTVEDYVEMTCSPENIGVAKRLQMYGTQF
jgi:hypothetical protein